MSRPANKLKAEGAAMDIAKNILLFFSNTLHTLPNSYANEGHGGWTKDGGHHNLCLLRTREIATGVEVSCNDLNLDM